MASTIKIKRSSSAASPSAGLAAGELAYSWNSNRLYIGTGTETDGIAANIDVIGGKYFTDMLDHTIGTLTASSAIVVDAQSKINNIKVGNLDLISNTLSTTNTNGNLLITPNGTGKTVITNLHIGDDATSIAEFIYDTVGGAVTGGTGITITNSDAGNTSTVSITNTGVTGFGTAVGSSTAIPVITFNAQGQLTTVTTASISTTLNIGGDTGTDAVALATDTLTFTGGEGIDTTVTNNTVTIAAEDASTSNKGVASFADADFNVTSGAVELKDTVVKTVTTDSGALTPSSHSFSILGGEGIDVTHSGTTITVAGEDASTSNKGVASFDTNNFTVTTGAVAAKNITLGSSTLTLGSTTTEIAGITQLTVDNLNFNGNVISTTVTNENIVLTPNGTGTVDVSGKRITGVAEPTQPTDAATKQYVDTVAEGLHIHEAAHCATTGTLTSLTSNGTVTYNNGTLGVGATLTLQNALSTLDGHTLTNGDRIMVKNEVNTAHNGIYVRTSATVLTRAADFNTAAEMAGGDFSFVENGTLYNNTGWVQTEEVITVGTDPVLWQQFSGTGTFTAGAGLSLIGTEFNVGGTTNRILVEVDTIDISPNYVGQSTITTLGTIGTGTWQGVVIGPTYGGTGVNNGTKTITLGGNFTHTGAHALGLTTTANTSVTLPTTGTLATLAGTETFTNKTLTSPVIATIVNTGTLTLPTSTDTLVGRATTDTLTNKTISGATITTGSINNTPIGASTANTGAFTTLAASGAVTFTSATDASAVGTAAVVLSGGLSVAKKIYVGDDIIGAGAATSLIDGFMMDGGTY